MKKILILAIFLLISLSACAFVMKPVKAQDTLDHFTIIGYPATVDSGQSFGGVTVTAYDADGNVITDFSDPVFFTSTDSQAVLPYTSTNQYTFVASDSGSHMFSGFTLKTTGAQTITVTDPTTGISATSSQITVNSALTAPTATAGLSIVDQGQTSTLSSTALTTGTSPYAYQWYSEAPGATGYAAITGATSSAYSFATTSSTTTGAYSFEVQVTDAVAVEVTSNAASVTVNSAPAVTVSPASWVMDVGQSETFTASASGGSGTISYQWYLADSAVAGATTTSYTYTPTAAGLPTIYCKITDDASSPDTATSNTPSVTVNSALVAPTASPSAGTLDQGQSYVLSSTAVSTGTSPYTYQWLSEAPGASSYSSISGATSNSYNFSTTSSTTTGSWKFELQVKDSASSAVTVTSNAISVAVNAAPTVSVAPTSVTLDVGQSQTFTATASGGSGTLSYQWYLNGAAVTGAISSTWAFTASTAGSDSIYCKVTDSASAPDAVQSNTPAVTVNAALSTPSCSASAATIDQGQSSTLSAAALTGGTSPYKYQWLQEAPGATGYSQISGATSSSFVFTTSTSTTTGTWSFELQVSDSASVPVVENSSAISVKVNTPPTVSITPISWSMNVGQSKTFTATATLGSGTYSGYQWYLNGAIQTGQTASTFNYSPAASGTDTITVTVTDSSGVVSAQSPAATVSVGGVLTVTVSPSSWVMDVGQSETFTANAAGGSGSYSSYQWYIGGVAQSGKTASFTYSPTSAGSPSITVSVTDTNGATAQSSPPSVTVNSALSTPSGSASKSSVDQGQSSTLSATGVSGGSSPYSYQWLQKSPGSSSYSQIAGATSSTYSFVTSASTTSGTWSFELTVTDSASVAASVTSSAASVTVGSTLKVSVAPLSATLDVGQSQMFTASASGGSGSYSSYQWYVDGTSQSGATSSTFNYSPGSAGSTYITVTVTDSLGANSSQSVAATATVSASPTVSITPSGPLTMVPGQSQTFAASASGGSGTLSYQWFLDGAAVGSNAASYTYTFSSGSHLVTCEVTDSSSPPVTSMVSNTVIINAAAVATSTPSSAPPTSTPAPTAAPTPTPTAPAKTSPTPNATSTPTPSQSKAPSNSTQVLIGALAGAAVAIAAIFIAFALAFGKKSKSEKVARDNPENKISWENNKIINAPSQLTQEPVDKNVEEAKIKPMLTMRDAPSKNQGKATYPAYRSEAAATTNPTANHADMKQNPTATDHSVNSNQQTEKTQPNSPEQDLWKKYFKNNS